MGQPSPQLTTPPNYNTHIVERAVLSLSHFKCAKKLKIPGSTGEHESVITGISQFYINIYNI